jgi:hypothetical protein
VHLLEWLPDQLAESLLALDLPFPWLWRYIGDGLETEEWEQEIRFLKR